MRALLINSCIALAIVACAPTSASARAPRLLDHRLVLAGVEAPQAVAEAEALSHWESEHWLGAMVFAEAGLLAGGAIGGGAGLLAWELGLQDPMGMFSGFVAVVVGSVAASLLSALGADLFADLIGTPSRYGAAFVGAALGLALALLTAPVTLAVGVLLFPALGAAIGANGSIDWSAASARRPTDSTPPVAAFRDPPWRTERASAATIFPVVRATF